MAISYQSQSDLVFKSPSVAKKFADKFQVELKDGTDDSKKKKLYVLAEWALQRGFFTGFNKCIDEIKKLDAKDAVVAAIEKTRDQLKKKPASDDPAAKAARRSAERRLPPGSRRRRPLHDAD